MKWPLPCLHGRAYLRDLFPGSLSDMNNSGAGITLYISRHWHVLPKSVKDAVYSCEKQILCLPRYTKSVSSLTLLIMMLEDGQRQVVVCSQVFLNSVLCWLDVLSLEKAVAVILTYIALDTKPHWNEFCFQSSSSGWMISKRLNQDSLKTVLCFPKQP